MSLSFLTIDPTSATPPPFEQLRMQVIDAVRSGKLAPGTRLPTVRSLAAELGIAPNTVARSYRELERDDVIETRGRLGSFVAENGDATARHAQEAARAYAQRVTMLGVSAEDALLIVQTALGIRP